MSDEEAKEAVIDQMFDGILVDRTRSSEEDDEEEKEAEEEQVFASASDALQYLADYTQRKVVVLS